MKISLGLLWILLLIIGWPVSSIIAQGVDCLCLPVFPSNVPRSNPDSVLVDTCGLRPSFSTCWEKALEFDTLVAQGIDTKPRMYAKYSYDITFDVRAIVLPELSPDSIVEVTWEMIDTAYGDLRTGMEGIETMFGAYVLRKWNPLDSMSQKFEVRLAEYRRADSVIEGLNAIEHVDAIFPWPTFLGLSSAPDRFRLAEDIGLIVSPLPAQNYATVTAQESILSIGLYDFLGREVTVPLTSHTSGSNTLRLDIHALSNGIWYLRVNDAVQSLIIQR